MDLHVAYECYKCHTSNIFLASTSIQLPFSTITSISLSGDLATVCRLSSSATAEANKIAADHAPKKSRFGKLAQSIFLTPSSKLSKALTPSSSPTTPTTPTLQPVQTGHPSIRKHKSHSCIVDRLTVPSSPTHGSIQVPAPASAPSTQ
ncbi:hypothetical protein DXG01_015682 [Tephrocybe rancida]|nr:hypothetical protein DXG01_015682 [Tephrocybe rancida]